MKTTLILALLGACVAVSYGCYDNYEYVCVKDDYKKCTAVEVCENAKKEKCGYDYCDYGYVCASKKKAVCKNFIALKKKCEKKKVCKEVKKACGYNYCGYDEECVKEKVCEVKFGYGRRLMGRTDAYASATAYTTGGYDNKKAPGFKQYGGYYYEPCDYCKKKERLECYDAYSCVKKEPCKEVVVKKCVKDVLRPEYDVCNGGHEFYWDNDYGYGEECGDEYCDYGYKCAYVYYQKCSEKCGDGYCDYGYECVAEDDDCKKYAYLETVCKDVYEPTCVALGYYAKEYYYPKCKTVYKCDEEESVCGGKYCGYGYTCAVKECGGYGYKGDGYKKDPYYEDSYGYKGDGYKKDPYYEDSYGYKGDGYKKDPYYEDSYGYKGDGYKKDKPKKGPSSSTSTSSAVAAPGSTSSGGSAVTEGNAVATTSGIAITETGSAGHKGKASGDDSKGTSTSTAGFAEGDDGHLSTSSVLADAKLGHR